MVEVMEEDAEDRTKWRLKICCTGRREKPKEEDLRTTQGLGGHQFVILRTGRMTL